jgi:hypothetical protein
LIKKVNRKINYEYDFRDSWEDSGSMDGYEEKRKILKDKKHKYEKNSA